MVPRFGFQESNFKYSENFFCPSHANLILVNTVHCISVLNLYFYYWKAGRLLCVDGFMKQLEGVFQLISKHREVG